MDYLVILNIAAFILAIVQTYKAYAQTREAQKSLERLDDMQSDLSKQLGQHQALLNAANSQVTEQGEKQRQLLLTAGSQTQQIQEQLQQIEEIRQALTTRFIGRFTEYFPQVVNIIEGAQKEIVIFCDFPGIGIVTVPNCYIRYRQAIERKSLENREMRVEITFLNRERRLKVTNEQFKHEGESWNRWKDNNRDLLDQFLFTYAGGLKREALSKTNFLSLLEELDERLLQQEFAHADYREIDAELSMYFWLVDSRIAILAITPFTDEAGSYGFITSDFKLLSALKEISNRYHLKDFRKEG